MNNGQKYLRLGWFTLLLLAGLLWANAAKADSIINLTISVPDSGTSDWMVSDGLNDWFFNPASQPTPAEQWTSDSNIATLNYWLSLVLELGDENDSTQLVVLYGSGTISSPDPSAPVVPIGETSPVTTQVLVNETSLEELDSSVPEPVTLWLFAGGMALLALKRKCLAIIDHGPL